MNKLQLFSSTFMTGHSRPRHWRSCVGTMNTSNSKITKLIAKNTLMLYARMLLMMFTDLSLCSNPFDSYHPKI